MNMPLKYKKLKKYVKICITFIDKKYYENCKN